MTEKEIIKEFKAKNPLPLYLLHGDESYFIDQITSAAEDYLLDAAEKDFNLTVIYGKEVNIDQLKGHAKQYPMMAERQVIIVKEAQDVKDWDALNDYFEKPVPTTVLILAHKHKKANGNKKFLKLIKKNGLVFESKKLYENQVGAWIVSFLLEKGYSINQKSATVLVEYLGSDLSKIVGELNKLMIILPKGTEINEKHVEENIGISKDYNTFELTNAIATRDILKANRIIQYFEHNPKAGPLVMIITLLFNFHLRLMRAHCTKTSDINSLMSTLRISFPAAKELLQSKRIYNLKKTAQNISILHEYDLKSKGINRGPGSDNDLLRELIYLLMH